MFSYISTMTQTRWLDASEMQLWRGFVTASHAVLHRVEADLNRDTGLSFDDYEVLVYLSEANDLRMRMSDLSRVLNNSRSRLTQRIDRMEDSGLVRRQRSPEDGRSVLAAITTRGLNTIAAAAPSHVMSVREHFIDQLTSTQITATGQVLDDLLGKLEQS